MSKIYSHVGRCNQVCYTELNDEIVILNPENENLYHLNTTAAELWRSLDAPKTILQLSDMLSQKYDGTAEHYQQDVMEWIDDAEKKGLLVIWDKSDVTINA